MRREFVFDSCEEFLDKRRELLGSGVAEEEMTLYAPHPVHGLDDQVNPKPSRLRYFTFIGALTGLITGFAFPIYTVYSWPLITGGKPLVSTPAFVIIAFELTILFGGVISFLGFLLLSRLPSVKDILTPEEYGNKFAILIEPKEPQ